MKFENDSLYLTWNCYNPVYRIYSVYFLFVWINPCPAIILTNFWIHGMCCVCVCVCVCVCKNVCMYACMHVCIYACTCMYVFLYVCECMCGYVGRCVCMRVCMYICKEHSARGTSCRSPVPNKGRAVVRTTREMSVRWCNILPIADSKSIT